MEEDGKEREGGVDVWLPPRCLAPEVAASFPVAVCMPEPLAGYEWRNVCGGGCGFAMAVSVVTAGAVSAVSIAVAASMGQPFNTAEDGSCFAGVGTSMARLAWELGDAIDRKFSSLVPDIYVGAS
uniref:Uncharacterized protein LOC105056892 isoform X1 n=1 Tax=Elaeis guineensis var. tenera TaxID=51953 RepID=A0A6I9S5M4_ELAGV|nr:uncharacterized protein LOC105056892 isoform X1 [Elaeis guineensis]